MYRIFHLIALALATAAVAVPVAQGVTDPSGQQAVDPLAVSYLRGQGYSPGEIKVMVGQADPLAVSYQRNHGFPQAQDMATAAPGTTKAIDPLAISYLRGHGLSPGEIKVVTQGADPLAVSYLRGQGLSQDEIAAWTAGVCSQESRPASCFTSLERTATPAQSFQSGGFDWTDAGVGAIATLGMVLLLAGLGAGLAIARQNRGRPAAGV